MVTSSANRPTVWEWTQVALLVVNLAWTTLSLGGFRPDTMVVTSLLTGALLVTHLIAAMAARGWEGFTAAAPSAETAASIGVRTQVARFHPAGWWLLPFLLYAAGNVCWVTPVRWLGWCDWFNWAQPIAVFWVVLNGVRSRPARSVLFGLLTVLGLVAVVLACYQRFVRPDWLMLGRTQVEQFLGRASGPFGIPNSLAALLLLLLPPVLALACRRGASAVQRVVFGYLAVVFGFGLGLTVSRGAWIALALVAVGWPLVTSRAAWRGRLQVAAAIGLLLFAVATTAFYQSDLVRERWTRLQQDGGELSRPLLWRVAWRIFQHDPLFGSGAGSYRFRFEWHRPAHYQEDPVWAHNEYLNTLADYGVVGFALCFGGWAAVAVLAFRNSRRGSWGGLAEGESGRAGSGAALESRLVRGGLAAGLVGFALQLGLDFHFKIPALGLAFAILAALAVRSAWPDEKPRRPAGAWSVWLLPAVTVLSAWLTVWVVWPRYRAEALRYEARRAIDLLAIRQVLPMEWSGGLSFARSELRRATRIDATNGAAWADLSYAIALWSWIEPDRLDELAVEAEKAADRALACSSVDPEAWLRRGIALDMQRRHLEAGAAFVHALSLAPARARVWYHQAFHLSLIPEQRECALAALAFCLRLDAGNREAQALRRRLTDPSPIP